MNKVEKSLTKARELVKKGWCQDTYARDAKGNGVDYESRRAVSFCLTGAMFRARVPDEGFTIVRKLIPYDGYSPVDFNDHHLTTKRDVVSVLTKAIKEAKKL